ncbi:hypothetical protein TSMEX_003783 [Taenia solium]|eukprot:TsM_001092100 transcript=TsM_001092100 gene=TsM_001092100
MSQSRDKQRKDGLEDKPKQQVTAQDTPSMSSSEGMEEEIRLLEALVIDPEDETRFLAAIDNLHQEMLRNNDFQLTYVLDEKAIRNPFVAD